MRPPLCGRYAAVMRSVIPALEFTISNRDARSRFHGGSGVAISNKTATDAQRGFDSADDRHCHLGGGQAVLSAALNPGGSYPALTSSGFSRLCLTSTRLCEPGDR